MEKIDLPGRCAPECVPIYAVLFDLLFLSLSPPVSARCVFDNPPLILLEFDLWGGKIYTYIYIFIYIYTRMHVYIRI
jgi:hypothetical protein